jgi:hypothetical protein
MIQSILSPLRATSPPNAGTEQEHAADDRNPADPSGNRALLFGGDLYIADSHDVSLGTVAQAPEYNEGADYGQHDASND